MYKHILLHHHIFKNAGSTVISILERNFRERFATFEPEELITASKLFNFIESNGVIAVSSHNFNTRFYSDYRNNSFEGRHVLIDMVLLRHPIDRIASIYRFGRAGIDDPDPLCQLAKKYNFSDFLRCLFYEFPYQVNDVQVNLFANFGYYSYPPSNLDLSIAKERMMRFALLGLVDKFNDFSVRCEYFLRSIFGNIDFSNIPQNTTSDPNVALKNRLDEVRRNCDGVIYEKLEEFNQLDVSLYQAAVVECNRRDAIIPKPDSLLGHGLTI
jgi:hypothetical protein